MYMRFPQAAGLPLHLVSPKSLSLVHRERALLPAGGVESPAGLSPEGERVWVVCLFSVLLGRCQGLLPSPSAAEQRWRVRQQWLPAHRARRTAR